MDTVGVWSGEAGVYRQLKGRAGGRWELILARHPGEFAQRPPELLILTPSATGLAGLGALRPRVALLPGGNVALARQVRAASAVSYGLGRQNTLTLSSMDGDSVCLALQRSVVTLSGRAVEPQEWVLPFEGEDGPEEFLCLAGALLLLDERF